MPTRLHVPASWKPPLNSQYSQDVCDFCLPDCSSLKGLPQPLLSQLNYSQSLPVQGTSQHEVAYGQQTALGMQAWEKSPEIVRIFTRVTTVKPLPLCLGEYPRWTEAKR